MKFAVVSLFPDMIENYFNIGVIGRAIRNNATNINCYNPRDFAEDQYKTVDDKPYGGGAGMLLKPEPLSKAIITAKNQLNNPETKVIYLSPQGSVLTQEIIRKYVSLSQPLVLVCGRYEGIDQRVIDEHVDYEHSIGDYVLSGGELAALVMLDSMIRLLPGVLGDDSSVVNESFSDNLFGLLEYPQYTRPAEYFDKKVPDVLLSGNHQEIMRWRLKQVLGKTWLRRPNLLECQSLSHEQMQLLEEFKLESESRI